MNTNQPGLAAVAGLPKVLKDIPISNQERSGLEYVKAGGETAPEVCNVDGSIVYRVVTIDDVVCVRPACIRIRVTAGEYGSLFCAPCAFELAALNSPTGTPRENTDIDHSVLLLGRWEVPPKTSEASHASQPDGDSQQPVVWGRVLDWSYSQLASQFWKQAESGVGSDRYFAQQLSLRTGLPLWLCLAFVDLERRHVMLEPLVSEV